MTTGKHFVIDGRIRRSSTGRYVDRLLHFLQLIDKKNRYTILLQKDDDWQPTAKNFSVKKVRYPQFSFNPLDQITFPLLLYRLKPDLVHFTMTQQPLLYFGNIVTTTHDLTMFGYTHKKEHSSVVHAIRDLGYALLFWSAHRKSNQIIVPTYAVKKQLVAREGFTLPKINVTYESGELPKTTKTKRPNMIEENTPFIVHVGTNFPHKNLPRLIKAFEKLARVHKDLQLVLVGKIEFFFEQLKRDVVSKSPVARRIHLTGFISDEELAWVYKNAKCYVFPSLSEGFGLPGLEAMGNGLAVTASNIPVLKEVYGDSAHYFHPTSPGSMAKAIHEVITDQHLRENLIKNGFKRIKQFSWQKMAKQTLAVYEKTFE